MLLSSGNKNVRGNWTQLAGRLSYGKSAKRICALANFVSPIRSVKVEVKNKRWEVLEYRRILHISSRPKTGTEPPVRRKDDQRFCVSVVNQCTVKRKKA